MIMGLKFKLRKFIYWTLIGIYQARYHRNMQRMQDASDNSDIKAFKKYTYRAEDAWKKVIIYRTKMEE